MMKLCKTQSCSILTNQGDHFELIPVDLIVEILSRLPIKSIARLRCVSKLWNSRIRSPSFTKSFFLVSSSRPKLLFVYQKYGKTFFFSSPQPQNSSLLIATSHTSFPINYSAGNCRPVRGLVCGLHQQYDFKGGRRVTTPLICNPSTGQSLSLPRVKTRRTKVFSYLGYDPIDKQFKVLCMTQAKYGSYTFEEHQILTLDFGKKRPSWRMIKCGIPHKQYERDVYDGICINGVLYYLAYVQIGNGAHDEDIVCFDINSEKFACIRRVQGMEQGCSRESVLVNYKGKLAMLQPNCSGQRCKGKLAMLQPNCSSQRCIKNIQLWVLEDAEKNQWLSYIYDMSPDLLSVWIRIVREDKLRYVGMADTGEIVLSPELAKNSYYLVCLNIEKKTITKVQIGRMAGIHQKVYAFLDHVENLKLLPNF